jgi:putative membrane protein
MIFSRQEKELIESAVKAAESQTSGEIVPVVTGASGDYSRVGNRLGFAGFLIASALAAWVHLEFPFFGPPYLFGLQLVGASIGWGLGRLPPVVRLLMGEKKLAAEVHEAAFAAFARNGLHHTREETGILVFVSLLEHRVEILADRGIHAKVGEDFWKIEVQKIVLGIREGRAAETLAAVIREMGDRLREHFPRSADDRNELGDELRSR